MTQVAAALKAARQCEPNNPYKCGPGQLAIVGRSRAIRHPNISHDKWKRSGITLLHHYCEAGWIVDCVGRSGRLCERLSIEVENVQAIAQRVNVVGIVP